MRAKRFLACRSADLECNHFSLHMCNSSWAVSNLHSTAFMLCNFASLVAQSDESVVAREHDTEKTGKTNARSEVLQLPLTRLRWDAAQHHG